MKYRPTPLFIVTLVIIILAVVSLYLIGAVYFWQQATGNDYRTSVTRTDYRPNISHCFEPDESRELWDCIRHKEETNETQ